MIFQLYAKKYLKKFQKGLDEIRKQVYNKLVSWEDTNADVVQWIEQ